MPVDSICGMKTVFFILAFGIAFCSFGHGGGSPVMTSLTGTVLEAGTTEQLTGVKVSIPGTDIFTYTDRNGFYELPNIPLGTVTLEFSLVSFEPVKMNVDLSQSALSVVNASLESR